MFTVALSTGEARAAAEGACEANAAAPSPAPVYRVINLMPEFWLFWEEAESLDPVAQYALFRERFVDKYPQLYAPGIIDTRSAKPFDEGLAELYPQFVTFVQPHIPAMRRLSASIENDLPRYDALFRQTFPDFDYCGEVYFFNSLGSFDGATRRVGGQMALLFGLETMAGIYGDELDLAPLFIHELFHVYHRQHFGEESPDDPLVAMLWREGLAQYVAKTLVPDADGVSLYGMPPDIPQRAKAMLPELAEGLLKELDSSDKDAFNTYFSFNSEDPRIPPRAGYYVGYKVAERLGRRFALADLAKMQLSEVRPLIQGELADLAHAMEN